MQTESISGTMRNYISYEAKKRYEGSVNLDGITEHTDIHKSLHRCPTCGYSMMINKRSKKEWCEYCDRK